MSALIEWYSSTQTVLINTNAVYTTDQINILGNDYTIKVYDGWTLDKGTTFTPVYVLTHDSGVSENLVIESISPGMTIEKYVNYALDSYKNAGYDCNYIEHEITDEYNAMFLYNIKKDGTVFEVEQFIELYPEGTLTDEGDYAFIWTIVLPSGLTNDEKERLFSELQDGLKMN